MVRVAAVSTDENIRIQLARAFDAAPPTWQVTLHREPPADADVVVCGPDQDVSDAIRFDPAHPARVLAEVGERTVSASSRVMVVVGATGGCGTTTVALHLAAAGKACAIEAVPGGIRRRLALANARSWSSQRDDEPITVAALPVAPGLRVLLAPGNDPTDASPVVDLAARSFPDLVIDAGAEQLPSLLRRDAIGVLMLPPTRPGAEHAADLLARYDESTWAVVTNRVGPGSSLTRAGIEAILDRRVSVCLPCAPSLRDSEDGGTVLTSALSPWLWQVKRLWNALKAA